MATIEKVIRTEYPDGSVVLSNIRNKKGIPVFKLNDTYTATKVTTWYDGTPMDNSKADGKVYLRYKSTGEYFLVNLPNWGETFLEKNTVAELRAMSSTDILLIKIGYYKGVKLNGYYTKGDTPAPIEYYLSNTTDSDDGGSVFEVGDVKFEHDFNYYVHLKYYGVKGDYTDETEQIQRAFDKAQGGILRIHKPESEYLTGQILVGNVNVNYDKGVLWKFKDGLNITASAFEVGFRFVNSTNITWICNDGIFYMNKSYYAPLTSEHNHIFAFDSVNNVEIISAIAKDSGGDGFYITGLATTGVTQPKGNLTYSIDVRLTNCYAENHKRNGCSLVGVKGFRAINSTFAKSSGPDIQAGFDIEPEARCEYSTDIYLEGCKFLENGGKGFQITYQKILENNINMDKNVNITLKDCYAYGNQYGFCTQYLVNTLNGSVNYYNCKSEKNIYSGFLEYSAGSSIRKYYENPQMINNNTSNNNTQDFGYGSQFLSKVRSVYDWEIGNSWVINPTAIDDRDTPLVYKGITFLKLFGSTSTPKGFYVQNADIRGYIERDIFVSPEALDVKLDYKLKPKVGTTGTGNYTVTNQDAFKEINNSSTTGTKTYVLPTPYEGLELTFRVSIGNQMTISPASGHYILGLQQAGVSASVFSSVVGDYIKIRGREDGDWDVIDIKGQWSSIGFTWTTAQRPLSPRIGTRGYNTTLASFEYYNGTSWIQIATNSVATTTTNGLVKQSAASADTAIAPSATYTQAEVQAILTELRDLKTKLRTAGILAT